MNKQELVNAIIEETAMTRGEATKSLEAVLDAISGALKKNEEVRLVGFGTFSVAERAASEGRDPRTRKPIQIQASKRVKFKAGKGLKDLVNNVKPAPSKKKSSEDSPKKKPVKK